MPDLAPHLAIHADDISRARRFYERVFHWSFRPWGPPDFLKIVPGEDGHHDGVRGALQKRHQLVPGKDIFGFECSISVPDVAQTLAAVEANGGTIVMPLCEIPTVGRLFKFLDTEGNLVCSIQYAEGYSE
jgi:predicted enzyme related to lactoylglutathione lyase